jgi:uncharacterized SAM-binding protein YcdF (DUF218 family)
MNSGGRQKMIMYLFLILISIILNSCAFSSKMCMSLLEESIAKKYDMIVVPGVPFQNGQWSNTMKARIYWSKYLYDKGIAKNVMYSGSAVYSPYCEAEIMALYAEKLGIRKENIYKETRAEHSTENIYYSYKKARKLGFHRIALASDPFQTKMLRSFIRQKMKTEIGLIPMVTDTLKAMKPAMTDPLIEYSKAFVDHFTALPDRENFLKRFRGTQGLDIDTTAYGIHDNSN